MVHFSVRPSLISSLVLVFLLFAVSSYAKKAVDVGTICKQTRNPSFCSSLLNSKPGGAAGADLVSLAEYTIDVVHGNISNTINLIKSLITQSASDPKAKQHYEQCLLHFSYDQDGALYDVEYALQMLKAGDYDGLNISASGIMTNVVECISGESPSDPPFPDPSLLPKYGEVVEDVGDIIASISIYLKQN